jgi:hypothetical protein
VVGRERLLLLFSAIMSCFFKLLQHRPKFRPNPRLIHPISSIPHRSHILKRFDISCNHWSIKLNFGSATQTTARQLHVVFVFFRTLVQLFDSFEQLHAPEQLGGQRGCGFNI